MNNMETNNFVGQEKWKVPPCIGHAFEVYEDDNIVEVLRPLLFFHKGQEITYGKINKYFTYEAIRVMENDGFVKFK